MCKQEAYPSQVDDVIKMTKFLLEQGAVVNVRDKTGYTPFMYACTFGNKDIADLLLNLSAIDATDNFGKTVIVDSFVSLHVISHSKFQALHYAVENRHYDIAKMLIDAGAETDICDLAGLTPRDIATSLALTDFEELLPEAIVDSLPTSAEQYKSYHDLVPTIFPDHKM